MRILDENSDKPLKNLTLCLTLAEALEMRDSLDDLINKPFNNHTHISDENFRKEITVCIYDVNNLNGFKEKSLNLIINDQ